MTVAAVHRRVRSEESALAFPIAEYRQRLASVQARMTELELELLLVHTPENICYLTGYQTSGYFAYQVLVVPVSGDPELLVRFVERLNVDEYSWLETARTWRDGDDLVAATVEAVTAAGGGRTIGVEKHSWFLDVATFERLAEALPGSRFLDAGRLVERVRLVKSPSELEYIREAARLADIAMSAAFDAARPYATELEVAAAAHDAQIRAGGEYTALPHYVASGYRGDIGHANWTAKQLVPGEILHLEFLGCAARYHAGVMRPVAIGEPTDTLARQAELCVEVQDKAFEAMRPGVKAGTIDRLAREALHNGGRPDDRIRTGYSMGIGFPPIAGESATLDLHAGADWALEAGMTFHMLSLMSSGIGFSETVVITKAGCERLTRSARSMAVA